MLTKALSLALAVVLLGITAHGGTKEEKDAQFAQKVKQGISKLGTGVNARIEVKLRDKTKLKGYVREAGEDSFVIVDEKTNAPSRVTYPQVRQVKGNNLSRAAEIALGVGVILLPIAIVLLLVTKD
jgi:hypothetical protein